MGIIDQSLDRGISGQPPFETEVILGNDGSKIGEARTCDNPGDLSVLRWAKEFDDHISGNPESIALIADTGAPTFIAREAMLELKERDPQGRVECLMRYARQATTSSIVVLTSNAEPNPS